MACVKISHDLTEVSGLVAIYSWRPGKRKGKPGPTWTQVSQPSQRTSLRVGSGMSERHLTAPIPFCHCLTKRLPLICQLLILKLHVYTSMWTLGVKAIQLKKQDSCSLSLFLKFPFNLFSKPGLRKKFEPYWLASLSQIMFSKDQCHAAHSECVVQWDYLAM